MKRKRSLRDRATLVGKVLPTAPLSLPLAVRAATDAGRLPETVRLSSTLAAKATEALPREAAPPPALKASAAVRPRLVRFACRTRAQASASPGCGARSAG